MAHRDGRHLDRAPSLSRRCGHGRTWQQLARPPVAGLKLAGEEGQESGATAGPACPICQIVQVEKNNHLT